MARGTDDHAFEMVKYTIFANEQANNNKEIKKYVLQEERHKL